VGDLDLRALELKPVGDLVLVADAKGDTEPEKASKPVRLVAAEVNTGESPKVDVKAGMVGKRDS